MHPFFLAHRAFPQALVYTWKSSTAVFCQSVGKSYLYMLVNSGCVWLLTFQLCGLLLWTVLLC